VSALKKALVTGGGAGLGRAFCGQLARAGYDVTVVDRKNPEDAVGDSMQCDLSDRTAVDRLLIATCDARHVRHGDPECRNFGDRPF
jgi:NAD(P)-dependent dehydrogenase (short-subunit alcohol dehydrogenase family)